MLQNKIYQNFYLEISKTFLVILFGLSIIALTVRAVNFLDLIVDSGYPLTTYFSYSFLNLFGVALKFIPLSFLLALIIFILTHLDDSEFLILWTSGEKKINIVNLFLLASTSALIFYLVFSTILTPLALNKSRQLLNNDSFNSFLPTVKSQQFSDSFKGFTFLIEKKFDTEIENIFLHDEGNNLNNLTPNKSNAFSNTIIAKKGIVQEKRIFLLNGQIISSKEDKTSEVIKFEQLNIDLSNLTTTTIKKPKIQETSTLILLSCFFIKNNQSKICSVDLKKEIIPVLLRRTILPFYIPIISLICSLLLLTNKKIYNNKFSVFMYSFIVLLFTELVIRYTGLNYFLRVLYILIPFVIFLILYLFLILKFSKETARNTKKI